MMKATVPTFCPGLTSFLPRYQVKEQGQRERSWRKTTGFQFTFHIVSVLILDVSDEKDGKWKEVKILIFALITEKLKLIQCKQIAFMGFVFRKVFFLYSKGRIFSKHKSVQWNELEF